MCPMCIGVATWYVTGATSASGIVALALKRPRARNQHEHPGDHVDDEARRDPGVLTERPQQTVPGTEPASLNARSGSSMSGDSAS
jgi:hypothetical protein